MVSKGLIRFNNDIGMVKVIGLVLEGNLVVKVLINREFGYVNVWWAMLEVNKYVGKAIVC